MKITSVVFLSFFFFFLFFILLEIQRLGKLLLFETWPAFRNLFGFQSFPSLLLSGLEKKTEFFPSAFPHCSHIEFVPAHFISPLLLLLKPLPSRRLLIADWCVSSSSSSLLLLQVTVTRRRAAPSSTAAMPPPRRASSTTARTWPCLRCGAIKTHVCKYTHTHTGEGAGSSLFVCFTD